jgi:hypothetical protein
MPKGDRTKELSFRLWKEGKSLAEIQAHICRNSQTLEESVKQWASNGSAGIKVNGNLKFETEPVPEHG